MKRLLCFIMVASSLFSLIGCNKSKNEVPSGLDNSLALIESEMGIGKEDALAVLEILCDVGLDAEIEYIYQAEADGEVFYKVWYGLHLMKVYMKDGQVEKIIRNQEQIYPKSTPDEPKEENSEKLDITVISITSPVKAGSKITLEIQGQPDTKYDITVKYASGASSASGLETKTSDDEGKVSWSWRVGSQVKAGIYTATVSAGKKSLTVEFEVE